MPPLDFGEEKAKYGAQPGTGRRAGGERMVTKRQKQLLDYLRDYIEKHGYAPTLEEIGRHFSLSSLATVHKHLQNLERKGRIRRLANHSRAMELVPEPRFGRAIEVPLLGRGETFALRVQGDSMVDEGILDGDIVVVESRTTADDGATVVALVRGE